MQYIHHFWIFHFFVEMASLNLHVKNIFQSRFNDKHKHVRYTKNMNHTFFLNRHFATDAFTISRALHTISMYNTTNNKYENK